MLVFDIETDGLDLKKISKIHTLWIYDYSQDEYKGYRGRTLEEGVRRLHEAETVVGHNIIDYDNPVIKKFFPWFSPKKVLDTLVWSRLIFPDIFERDIILANKGAFPRKLMGRHSLQAWGYRLGELKETLLRKLTGKMVSLRWMSTASRTLLSLRNSTRSS